MTTTATTRTATTCTGALPGRPAARLRRLRWAVRATLTLGVAASVAANVLHARPNPISQIIAAWPPLALLLTVELISRVPHHRRALGAIRIAATAVIAGIATWVSYWHLAGVAARYGETGHGAAYLLPISVDGLVIVASVSLVEITARIGAATPSPSAASTPTDHVAVQPSATPTRARVPATAPALVTAAAGTTATPATAGPAAAAQPNPARRGPVAASRAAAPSVGSPRSRRMADTPPAGDRGGADRAQPPGGVGGPPTVAVPAGTAAAVAYWRRRDPDLHPADIAARIGKSERTVRRYWSPPATNGTFHANGHPTDGLRR